MNWLQSTSIQEGLFSLIHALHSISYKLSVKKTQTIVGMLYLVCSPHFIPESVFYIQSVMLSPHSFHILYVPKLGQLFCLRTQLWIALDLGGLSYRAISSPKQLKRGLGGVPKQSCRSWSLSNVLQTLGLCFIICAQKSMSAKWNYTFPPLIYTAESSIGFGQREESTLHAAKLVSIERYVHCTQNSNFSALPDSLECSY